MVNLNRWLLSTAWLVLISVSLAQEPLTTTRSIRELSVTDRERHLPVKLEAVVTYYHPAWGVLFVYNGGDGVCVGVSEQIRPSRPFTVGTLLQVEGTTGPGEFLPVVLPSRLEAKGVGVLPPYQRVTFEELFSPAMDCRPVEVLAVVKGTSFSDESLVVDIEVEGHMIRAISPQNELLKQLPWQLVERRVRVRGVAGTHFNDQRQMSGRLLFVAGLGGFALNEESKPVEQAPLVSVDGLLRVDSPLRQRVRVKGTATHVMNGRGLYLRGEGGSMLVQTAQPTTLMRGDEVEVEGYAVVTPFRPSLSALDIKKTGTVAEPKPIPFEPAKTRHSREQCELITLDAEFLEHVKSQDTEALICRSEGQIFEAQLSPNLRIQEELVPQMKLRLTGICEFISTRPLVIPRNATGFRLILRSADDIVILQRNPWWSEQRARWILGSLIVLALTVGAWAITLQIVVRSQSSVIRQQAEQQGTLEERQRIARDLHDTLEQELVGVTMLLDDTTRRLSGTQSPANQPLNLARRLLRRAREESRTTIRELRSVTLEKRGLPAAMEELLRQLITTNETQLTVTIGGTPSRLAGVLETQLLRIAQEAVANAAHHASAKHIRVTLDYLPDHVKLSIQDDGCGFDPKATTALEGHFGLSGMNERAAKIGSQLQIHSELTEGTHVEVMAKRIKFQGNS